MRWLVVALAALAALAACNRLFGISEIPFAGDAKIYEDAPPDAPPRAILEIGDPALDFGEVTRGQSSFAATVNITNVGDAPTGMLTDTGSGATSEYLVNLDTCNTALAPGAGCKLQITFTPEDVGTFMDTVVIGDGVAMTTIMLTGTGLTPGALNLSSPVGFGSAFIGTTNNKQSIDVTNEGSTPVMIMSYMTIGTDSGAFAVKSSGSCSTSTPVGSGATCTIDVDYVPTKGGSQLASLQVMTVSNSNPSLSSLGGTGLTSVSVATAGTGVGTVDSQDNAIMCAPTCSATFDTSTVTLTGVVPGKTAVTWSPNCMMQSSTSCAITVTAANYDVTATFTPFPVLTVALTGSPGEVMGGGIDCESATDGPTCSLAFAPGTQVALTATPLTGSLFNDWTGACVLNSGPTCDLTMTSDLSTTADFETGHVLNVKPLNSTSDFGDSLIVGSASCDVTNGCSVAYAKNVPTSVTLVGTGDTCSTFEGFSGGACGSDTNPCTVDPAAMQVTTVYFQFVPKQAGSGSGGAECVTGS